MATHFTKYVAILSSARFVAIVPEYNTVNHEEYR